MLPQPDKYTSLGDRLIPFCESRGTAAIRRMFLEDQFTYFDREKVQQWLLVKEAESKDRADERAEESLSISRRALLISRIAIILAAISATYTIRDSISSLAMWILSLVQLKP